MARPVLPPLRLAPDPTEPQVLAAIADAYEFERAIPSSGHPDFDEEDIVAFLDRIDEIKATCAPGLRAKLFPPAEVSDDEVPF